jgi:hypothetical protein
VIANVNGSNSASLVHCEDRGEAYDTYLGPERAIRTAVMKIIHVPCKAQLRRNNKGVWVLEKIDSRWGGAKLRP